MTSPLKFNVASLLGASADGLPAQRSQTGPAPARIGGEMLAVPEGEELTVDATLTPLGGGVLVDADVRGLLHGECSRCLRPLNPPLDIHVSQVFAADDDFITGDPESEEEQGSGDEIGQVEGDEVDLLQPVIDEVGLSLPFAPVCENGCDIQTPKGVTTGVSGEKDPDDEKVDPRWAGLEKFL